MKYLYQSWAICLDVINSCLVHTCGIFPVYNNGQYSYVSAVIIAEPDPKLCFSCPKSGPDP